ncbi:hypothetical protein C0V97_12325 [Asaia sp. W19]|uniref:hypothetical protein n=1 Tax=unclassified Asaia TaxID=2685023 RepID=UPI000F8F7E13|nr:hypothetical protein [Asaia sp. W19]RUT25362.1 hypothetical protein C0V97_12325 [Asaia sp. W19]
MRIEDVKEGMKVLVKASTYSPVGPTRAMVGHVVEVRGIPSDGDRVILWNIDKTDWWNFNASDIESAEAPQVPAVTINGTVYVPEDTIKTPEPVSAPKFFWGQWVKVEDDDLPAIVIRPEVDSEGDIRLNFMGKDDWTYRQASWCTPIGT